MRKKTIIEIIISCFVYIALVYTGIILDDYYWVDTLSQSLKGFSINSLLITGMIYFFLSKTNLYFSELSKNMKMTVNIVSFVFSLIMGIGKYFQFHLEDINIYIEFFQLIMIPIVSFGFYFILKNSIAILLYWFSKTIYCAENKLNQFVFSKYKSFMCVAIILLGLIPYILAFYPCVISYDGSFQIGQFLGEFVFSDHHTPLVTIFYGYFSYLSMNTSLGHFALFIPILIQIILYLISIWQVFELLEEFKIPYILRWVSLLFFTFFPIFPIHIMTYSKDSLYFPLVLLFSIMLIKALCYPKKYLKKITFLILFSLVSFFIYMIRKNGIVIILAVFPLIAIVSKGFRIRILLIFLIIMGMSLGVSELFYKGGVKKVEMQIDTYTVLFQQTARYAKEHPEDITKEEYDFLDTIFEYWKVPYDYNPRLADPVKRLLRTKDSNEVFELDKELVIHDKFSDYLAIWFKQFKKHPSTYISSFVEGSYGYYYPDVKESYEGLGWYKTLNISNILTYSDSVNRLALRQLMEGIAYFVRGIPIIGMVYSMGLHSWIVFLAFVMFVLNKKVKFLIALLPVILTILINLVSPVSGYIRYALPIYSITPLVISLIWAVSQKEKKE